MRSVPTTTRRSRFSLRPLALLALGGLALGAACLGTPENTADQTSALTGSGVTATLSTQSDWGTGYCDLVTVTATGAATTGWQVVVALNSTYSQAWNAAVTVAGGQLTAASLSWNGALAVNGSTSFGFCGTSTSSTMRPTLVSVTATGTTATGTGGSVGSGGTTAGAGGSTGTGGAATGGTTGAAGHLGAGGTTANGGAMGAAGTIGTGGTTATGGTTGAAGRGGAGGTTVTGGTTGAAGKIGTGGTTGAAGTIGAGGAAGTGGTTPIGGAGGCSVSGTPASGAVSVNLCTTRQTMDGFGAADVWNGPLTAAQNTLFWDPTNGIGLSLLRIGIDVNGTPLGSGAYTDAIAANQFGVKVWGTPWSPPAADKSNNDVNNGGTLDTSAYASWANILAAFATTFKSKTGFPLYAISAQNEPDFTATYSSCLYSSAQMVAFIKVLGPALHGVGTKLLAAEPDSWSNLWAGDNYGNAILGDPTAKSLVDILATHDYGHAADSVTTRPAPPSGMTMPLWETEMSDLTAEDVDIGHGIQVATWIYAGITTGGASAWHYWWLVNLDTDGEGLLQSGGSTAAANIPKRLYTMGNFSKFVRPGYVNVSTGTAPSGVLIAAFKNPSDGTAVVVAINPAGSAVNVPFFLSGGAAIAAVTPYVTSASANLAAGAAIPVVGANFSATLGAQTVTTFVGKP